MNYFLRLDEDINTSLSKNKRESNIAATYVNAAAESTSFAPAISSSDKVLVLFKDLSARLLASNSTGKVTKWNRTENENNIIPKFNKISCSVGQSIPINTSGIDKFEAKLHTGTSKERIFIGQ